MKETENNLYVITVNGGPIWGRNCNIEAKSREAAIDAWLVREYGSVLSFSAPYNVGATLEEETTRG